MSDDRIIKLMEKVRGAQYVTPRQVLLDIVENHMETIDKCDSLLVLGVKNDSDSFGIRFSDCANIKNTELMALCDLFKDQIIKNFTEKNS